MSNRAVAFRAAAVAGAVLLLNASLAFTNVWPTPFVHWRGELSVELALFILAVCLAASRGWTASARWLRAAPIVGVILVIGRYADVTVQSLFGREINLFWDSRHFSAVGAMLAVVARPWLVAAVIAGAVCVPVALYLPLRWSMRQVTEAARRPRFRRVLATVAGLTVMLAVVQHREEPFAELPQIASPVLTVFTHQATVLALELSGPRARQLPQPPAVDFDFSRVRGADVFVIFLESYGATSWDRPEFAARLVPARARLLDAIRSSGRDVVSAFAESPTFGGSSWLAHVSLLSGTEVRDGDTNFRLMAEMDRPTLVSAFKRHGYRAVAVMPGLQHAWPEGRFYGFDEIYGVEQLDYHGPSFGWWDVTDQYALAKMDSLAVAKPSRPPLFVFFPTISTHTPFIPVPPFQPDWSRMLDRGPYDPSALTQAWDEQPDWLDLGPGYTKALTYSFDSIGSYLTWRRDRDFVVVLIGDHQPPAVVSGEGASWEVPVHVIASRPALLEQLVRRGFKPGLEPKHPALTRIYGLTEVLLESFGDRAE